MRFILISFKDLTSEELYDALKLRSTVFVIEQNCIYQDMDDKDKKALHLLGYNGDQMVAYSRLLGPGLSYKEASIGRVVVDKEQRGKSSGRDLMQKAIEETFSVFKTNEIVISAQQYLEKFYTELGFIKEGEMYLEDDIPHIKMRLKR
jgi:ElaA protein